MAHAGRVVDVVDRGVLIVPVTTTTQETVGSLSPFGLEFQVGLAHELASLLDLRVVEPFLVVDHGFTLTV